MLEKRRAKRRKDEYSEPGDQEVEKPTKLEYKVAQWMKRHIKTKKTKFLTHNVEYFTSNKAIDALMGSDFVKEKEYLFSNREKTVEFLDIMLEHKFFHRAKKIPVPLDDNRGASKTSKKDNKKDGKIKEKEEKKLIDTDLDIAGMNSVDDFSNNLNKEKKRKRKIRLDMHSEQIFVDGSEAYVWIYDPIPLHYWIYGFILLLGAIGICLFPLWPQILRTGVYYLSVVAAGFLVFILALTVIRLIVFVIIWAITGGKLHLWIFPNLTEDVGFFASFWPLYESKYVTNLEDEVKQKKKVKASDDEADTVAENVSLSFRTIKGRGKADVSIEDSVDEEKTSENEYDNDKTESNII